MNISGQAAFEYMIIIGMVLVFMLPIWAYVSNVQQQASQELSISYSKNAVEKIARTADLVFSQGAPAKVKVSVFIPEGVDSYSIENNTIGLKLRLTSGLSDVFATSNANMTGTLPTSDGNYIVLVEAKDGYVEITPQ